MSDPAKMGVPVLTSSSRPGQELESHLILASEFLATQIDPLTRFSVPLRLRPQVRAALGDTDANNTNAGALRRLLGRGSLSTIQKHLDTIRADGMAQALEVGGAAPDAPKDLMGALWAHAWAAAQARTAGALAQSQQQAQALVQALAVAQADAAAAQAEADEAAQALALVQQQAQQAQEIHAAAQEAAQALAAAQQAQQSQELAQARQALERTQQAAALERAKHAAAVAALRGEVDRLINQLADLRAALGKPTDLFSK